MGGRSGQGIKTVNSGVSEGDYKATQPDDHYSSKFNGDYNAKTINAYTETGYMVNHHLRKGLTLRDTDKQYIKNLDKSLNRLPNYKGIVYRSIGDDGNVLRNQLKNSIGGTVKWSGYSSATRDRTRQNKGGHLSGAEKLAFVIRSKRGKRIEKFSGYPHEQEVLFKRNSKFKVVAYRNGKFYLKEL